MKLCASLAIGACLLARSPHGRAESDGVYGRFDGDIDFSAALGSQLAQGSPNATFAARALFLGTVGPYVALTEAVGDTSDAPRTLAVGAAFRPLFIPRWALDMERGPALLDLTLDATTFDLGVLWAADAGRHFSERPGFELGLGTEIPLMGHARGPWIGVRGALRWRGPELSSDEAPRLGPAVAFTLSWHFVERLHLVDYHDQATR
jgi:hypothetical protein